MKLNIKKPKKSRLKTKKKNTEWIEDERDFGTCRYHIERYQIVNTEKQLKDLKEQMMKLDAFAFDTETNTLHVQGDSHKFSCVGISISWSEDYNFYIPLAHKRYEDFDKNADLKLVQKYLRPVFKRKDCIIIGHNLKFDAHVFERIRIPVCLDNTFDTQIASHLIDENTPNGLKENSEMYLGANQTHFNEVTKTVPLEVKKEFGLASNSRVPFSLVTIDDGAPYALDDAYYTFQLYLKFKELLVSEKMDKIFYKTYRPFLKTMFEMEEQGVTVDVERLNEMDVEMAKDIEKLEYQIYELSGVTFNIGSNQQLAELLFGYGRAEPVRIDIKNDYNEKKQMSYLKEYKRLWIDKNRNMRKWQKAIDERGEKTAFREFIKEQQERIDKKYDKELEEYNKNSLLKYSFHFKPLSTTASGMPQVNSDTFWKISHFEFKNKRKKQGVKMCDLLCEYKKLAKLKTAFVDGLKELIYDDGKVHPSFNVSGTTSGRLSCSNPNLQQLPKADDDDKYQIRSLFIGSIDEVTGKRKRVITVD